MYKDYERKCVRRVFANSMTTKVSPKDSKIWIIYIVPLANGSYEKNCLINIKNT